MKKYKKIIPFGILAVIFVCFMCSCNFSLFDNNKNTTTKPQSTVEQTQIPTTEEPTTQPPTEDPNVTKLKSMSLKEKAGQTVVCGLEGDTVDDDLRELVQEEYVGGVILFSKNIDSSQQLTKLSNDIRGLARKGFPLLLGMDEEGGQVSRLPSDVESMSSAYSIAQSQSTDHCFESGSIIGQQLKAFGISTGFSPDLDIWSNSDNTVIADRAYGTTAEDVSKYAISAMKGLLSQNIIAVGKHFPGHGDTSTDSHYSLPVVTKTKSELEKFEFLPFKEAIKNNIPAIMVAHILCTEIDNKNPASLSKTLVTDILKGELGFDGVVFSDDLTMGAIEEEYSIEKAAVKALNAGCDMLLVCHGNDEAEAVIEKIIDAVKKGDLSQKRLDDAVLHILKMKSDYNLNSNKIKAPDIDSINQLVENFNAE